MVASYLNQRLDEAKNYSGTHTQKGHLLTVESSCHGVILCSAATRAKLSHSIEDLYLKLRNVTHLVYLLSLPFHPAPAPTLPSRGPLHQPRNSYSSNPSSPNQKSTTRVYSLSQPHQPQVSASLPRSLYVALSPSLYPVRSREQENAVQSISPTCAPTWSFLPAGLHCHHSAWHVGSQRIRQCVGDRLLWAGNLGGTGRGRADIVGVRVQVGWRLDVMRG